MHNSFASRMKHCPFGLSLLLLLQACGQGPLRTTEYSSSGGAAPNAGFAARCGPPPGIPESVYSHTAFDAASVVVRFQLLAPNEITEVQVVRSSGFPDLDTAAKEAVSKWRCEFPDVQGRPAILNVPFVFKRHDVTLPPTTFKLLGVGIFSAESTSRVADSASFTGFRSESKGVRLVERTNQVKAVLNGRFGVTFKFDGPFAEQAIGYRTVWTFPVGGLLNPVTGQRTASVSRSRTCHVGSECSLNWIFSEEWERVTGTWKLDIWLDDELVATQSFNVTAP
jgi:TonB family protein